ncbi:metallophosphoesterase [Variovorax sp. JS1663]|uniref:metallophosphoesterase n=1 Tax=Variovorax sp. JS1663 TaxID=1851577 RepID=UPI000B345F87|nr:metallophosphoesterase [Variovorax sp. JS1663]OUM02203.1 hypothetical protein A8M77_12510 [Variovorax sp. JS1663]
MNADPTASRLLVLSDLHLAPPGEQCVFAAHEPLVALIDHLAAAPATDPPQRLVLNGDVFDFLQIPGYDALTLPLAPQRMETILDALDAEPAHRNVVQALRRFTAAGHALSCLPGNHDPELNLATVQQVLAKRLGSDTTLPPWDGQWRLHVAGHTVMGVHGHHEDPFNAISSTQMRQAQGDGDETVPLPPGSRLVCQVINPFRRAKTPAGTQRFPFIDRLPSDQAVVLAIMLLDPRLAGKRLKDALGIGAAAMVRKALMASGLGGPMLLDGTAEAQAGTGDPDWVDELTANIAWNASDAAAETGVEPLHIEHELDAYFAGQAEAEPGLLGNEMLSGGEGAVRALLWRALGKTLAATREGFRAAKPDRLSRQVTDRWSHDVVAITGHTHAAKSLVTAEGGVYLNTGTWLHQVMPPDDGVDLPEWLAQLQQDKLPCWNGQPVALVDAGGARLMRWSGAALEPWQDALA